MFVCQFLPKIVRACALGTLRYGARFAGSRDRKQEQSRVVLVLGLEKLDDLLTRDVLEIIGNVSFEFSLGAGGGEERKFCWAEGRLGESEEAINESRKTYDTRLPAIICFGGCLLGEMGGESGKNHTCMRISVCDRATKSCRRLPAWEASTAGVLFWPSQKRYTRWQCSPPTL
jgi:hypothetical protein